MCTPRSVARRPAWRHRQAASQTEEGAVVRFRIMVIQLHRQLADWARKALGHVLDAMDRLVRETCRDDSRFIDAGSAVFAGKRMRPGLELPLHDVIETVHGDHPRAHPHTPRLRPSVGTCQW